MASNAVVEYAYEEKRTMEHYDHRTLQNLAYTLTITCVALGSAAALAGCGDLQGLFGNTQPITCNLTGSVVGEDGEMPSGVDIQWVPDAELSSSFELIQSTINDDGTFTITELTIEAEAAQISGELRFGEDVVPPNPQNYDQAVVRLDIPLACMEDLGVITLPLRGSGDTTGGTTGGTNNGTVGGTTGGTTSMGLNNGTAGGTTGGTNNGTTGMTGETGGTNNGTTGSTNNGTTGMTGGTGG